MRAILQNIHHETPHIATFWFKPDKPLRYTAGQFTELHLPHQQADERGEKRWFTLSSSPHDALVSVTTRVGRDGSTYKQALLDLQPGAVVHLAEPMGDFVLPLDHTRPLIFVAAGLGVTPMHSMVKWLTNAGKPHPIHMLYATRQVDDAAFRELFEHAPITFELIPKEPPANWSGRSGLLTSDIIATLPGAKDNALIYLSGPEPMIEQFAAELPSLGIEKSRLVTDYFPGYAPV